MEDKQIRCANCGQVFTLTVGEQDFYQQSGMSEPKRCETCRGQRKLDRDGGGSAKGDGGRVERAKRAMDALFKPAKK
jgi:hypothetical protein